MAKTDAPKIDLSTLAETEPEKFSAAVKDIPEEIKALVKKAHEHKYGSGEWFPIRQATQEAANHVVSLMRKWTEHRGLTLRQNTTVDSPKGTVLVRVTDKVTHKTTDEASANAGTS